MVARSLCAAISASRLSVLALSSRFDGACDWLAILDRVWLSVLTLSSHFDGGSIGTADIDDAFFQYSLCRVVLMVPLCCVQSPAGVQPFQYSLCRVVLMVAVPSVHSRSRVRFQYSLCRVVLMVSNASPAAGSSRFFQYSLCRVVLMVVDSVQNGRQVLSFSTRSVESF